MEQWIQWLQKEMETNQTQRKILLTGTFQKGRQLTENLARRGCQVLHLKITTWDEQFREAGRMWQQQEGIQFLDAGDAWYGMKRILKALQLDQQLQYFQKVELSPGMISAMLGAVTELRHGCISSVDIRQDTFITPEKAADLKRILHQWETYLQDENLADSWRILQWLEAQPASDEPGVRLYLTPDEEYTALQQKWLKTVCEKRQMVILEGPDSKEVHPDNLVSGEQLHLSHSSSCWQEIRDLFRKIKSESIPLDEAVLLLPVAEPYTTLCFQLAGRYNIPMTIGHGIGVAQTRPGKLFNLMIKWIKSDYQAAILASMLREGLVKLPKNGVGPVILERILKEQRVGWSKERYLTTLQEALAASTDLQEEQKARLEGALELLQSMMSLLNISNWVKGVSQWFNTYARVTDEDDREAKAALLLVLETASCHFDKEAAVSDVLDECSLHAASLRVRAESPMPEKVHCDHLGNGLMNPRRHVLIPGLSARQFPGTYADGPVLLDQERMNLGTLLLLRDRPRQQEEQLEKRLTGKHQVFHLSMPAYDPLEHREESPSALMLRLFRRQTHRPDADYDALRKSLNRDKLVGDILPLHEEERLDRFEDFLGFARQWPDHGRVVLKPLIHPFHSQGRTAFEQRLNGSFNPYNGMIRVDPSEVDPRENHDLSLSASQLEQLAKCPYIHFLQRLLKLYPEDVVVWRPDQWLDALQRGNLLHRVFEQYYRGVIDGGEKSVEALLNHLEQQVSLMRKMTPPPGERVFQKEMEELTASCRVFFKAEQQLHASQKPVCLELKFGLDEEHPVLGTVPPTLFTLQDGSRFVFRGAVDRIDSLGGHAFEIIDYKTGSPYGYHEGKPFDKARRLQHALYARVTEEILRTLSGDPEAKVDQASYYFPTLKGRGEKITYPQNEKVKRVLNDVLVRLLDAVKDGTFVDWGSGFDRRWEEYKPILQQNPDENQMTAMLDALECQPEDPVSQQLLRLMEVKCYE